MQRIQFQPAYILHARAYRNTSLLLEIFGRDHGRLGLVARGARKGRLGPLLQPFAPLLLSWTLRDDLGRLTGAESDGAARVLAGPALVCGFYLNELVYRLCHRHDPHPALFDAYGQALAALAGGPSEPALRRFEYRLLGELGYGPQLEVTADTGEAVVAGRQYRYLPEQGPRAAAAGPGGVAISGHSLLALARDQLDDAVALAEIRRLMRACLQPLLGDRPLRSRELYRSMFKPNDDASG